MHLNVLVAVARYGKDTAQGVPDPGKGEAEDAGLRTTATCHRLDRVGSHLPNLFQELVIALEFPGDMGHQAPVVMG